MPYASRTKLSDCFDYFFDNKNRFSTLQIIRTLTTFKTEKPMKLVMSCYHSKGKLRNLNFKLLILTNKVSWTLLLGIFERHIRLERCLLEIALINGFWVHIGFKINVKFFIISEEPCQCFFKLHQIAFFRYTLIVCWLSAHG